MQKIAKVIGKVSIYALDKGVTGEVAVLSEGDFTKQEITDGIGAELVYQKIRVYNISLGF